MKKFEATLIALFVFGCILYILHWPFAGLIRTFSALLLSFSYAILGVSLFNGISIKKILKKDAEDSISTGEKVIGVFAGLSGSVSVIAILFLVQRWPGAFVESWAASVSSIFILIIGSVLYLRKKTVGYRRIITKTAVLFTFVIIMWSVTKMYHEVDLEQFKAEIEGYQ